MNINWRGVFPAVMTQFRDDQSLNLEATGRHIEKLVVSGVHGIVMLGTLGENCSLEFAEKMEVLRTAIRQVNRRVPVLAGGAQCSRHWRADLRSSRRLASMVDGPAGDGLQVRRAGNGAHFRTVAKATDLPTSVTTTGSYGVDILVFADPGRPKLRDQGRRKRSPHYGFEERAAIAMRCFAALTFMLESVVLERWAGSVDW